MRPAVLFVFCALAAQVLFAAKSCDLENDLACINLRGASGWFQFCPKNTATSDASDGSNSQCVNIRPFRFQEFTEDHVPISAHSINKFPTMTLGSVTNRTFPQNCTAANNYICANTSTGGNVTYTEIPASYTINGATVKINFYVIDQAGTLYFGDESVAVTTGTSKFNIAMENYLFCGYGGLTCKQGQTSYIGKYITFQVTIKTKRGSSSLTKSGRLSTVDGITNFPSFLAWNTTAAGGAATKSWVSAAPALTQSGSNQVLRYNFTGPFNQMVYDPVVATQTADSATSGAASMMAYTALAIVALTAILLV